MLGYLAGAVHEGDSHARGRCRSRAPARRRRTLQPGRRDARRGRSSAHSGRDTLPERRPARPRKRGTMSATGVETELWGEETSKAVANFPVSGEPIPAPVVHWLGRIKAAAARVNAELGLLDPEIAERIAAAGDEVAAGEHDDQFPIDVFQTGSGTSSNMNANEVMANLAGDDAHPNDHVNMGQSSNDVFPSAVHLAALGEVTHDLLPAMDGLAAALERKSEEFADVVKAGRTHLMDAVPVTLGQEFGGYAAQIRLGHRPGARHAGPGRPDPARRHGHRHRTQHPLGVRRSGCATKLDGGDRARDLRAARPLRGAGQPRRPGRALRSAQGRRRLADQDRQRPRADGLRARAPGWPRSACRRSRRAPRSCPARSTR